VAAAREALGLLYVLTLEIKGRRFTSAFNTERQLSLPYEGRTVIEVSMGFFAKLFGKQEPEQPKSEPLELDPTAEMMDEDRFWKIAQDSLDDSGGDLECQENSLVQSLEKLRPHEIIGFRLRTDKLLYDTYTSEMWCAGYLMNGGCSDDMFEYFRLWVISRGREVFEAAKNNPDSLVQAADSSMGQEYDFEPFWYVALTAFEKTTGRDLYDHIDNDKFKFSEQDRQPFDFTWQEDDPESMERICPNLFRKFPVG
jgi:hypothetical protein